MDLDNPKTWVSGAIAVLASVFAWSAKRQVEEYDDMLQNHNNRLHTLEVDVAKRADVEYLAKRITDLGDRMNEQHSNLLKAMLGHPK